MRDFLRRAAAFRMGSLTFPLFLLALCALAYGPLLTKLGFYWDDFPMAWIATTMGGDGLARYFSTNRPVWGLIYRITTPLVGSQPVTWQIFALLLRCGTGLALWALLRLIWPDRTRAQFAAWAAALFVIYPGFSQQYISFLYSHFFIVLIVFLLSLALMVLALRVRGRWYWPLTAASLLLSLLNLLSMEYFFLLDLLRPFLIWVVLSDRESPNCIADRRKRLRQTLLFWLPYLAVFAGAMYWRSVLFGFQTYQPALMSRLKTTPIPALMQLIPLVLGDVWKASAGAWAKAFVIPAAAEIGTRNLQRFWLLVAAGALASIGYFFLYLPRQSSPDDPELRAHQPRTWLSAQTWVWQPVAIGILALFIAGGPFWLTDLQIGLVFPNDRFTLPFILGASLVLTGLLTFLPLPRWLKTALLGIALGFAIGAQFQYAISYNRDWSVQKTMFWQMVWRMPDIQPRTVLLSNELPVTHYTDNSLTAPLNWIYDPQNDPAVMNYALFYPTLRKAETLSNFEKNRPVELNYLATNFHGSTAQIVAFSYRPPGCLRVLDPQIDLYNWMEPTYLRESLALSTTSPILAEPQPGKTAPRPPEQIFGSEIEHGWCYYYEKADLARQQGDWQTVSRLGDEGFAAGDYPNDPLERFPFIEGYAHTGNWNRAIELTRDARAISPTVMPPMLCRLWERIQKETPAGLEQRQAVQTTRADLECK